MKRWLIWLPFIAFAAVLWLVAAELTRPADRTVRSRLVGQALPGFSLPAAVPGKPGLDARAFRIGEPRLLNIFASWCVPCAAEAPQLAALARAGVPIDAIAIRDKPEDVARFLARYGDPFRAIGADQTSAVQLALGSSGVPETFVIDGQGRIVEQHIGDLRAEDVARLTALVKGAR
ncbi:cytochrome c biogenesis protein CcmG, thiol:disulfide interchange protein DsbE [Sphingomonas guangdongensis]|uniref:Cytochrome c biogenesis protein CcmG, thiol:disulfide interchange protein DsbE n=1 Tax=Sphingomonas guangdongensis TaxID=1141890 RepID=A0A285R3L4_9SPHN|nr:redoxin family protein [Sphingomonas guangdongensis]SOB86952.1 cytochrome c biogenesis protein CcmG, thiol:disulfide interchange protein DsbE [Sphingomonas guangdongensis]